METTESLLLALYSDSVCFTKKDNSHIKEALFLFLASVNRHLGARVKSLGCGARGPGFEFESR